MLFTTKMNDKDFTLKQRKWLSLYLKYGNATKAAMESYDCKDRETAAQIGWENMRKLDYTEFLEEAGVTDKLLQEKITEGLDATRTVSAINTGKNATASSNDFVDVPDFMARHKYLETALKLKQKLIDRKDLTTNGKDLQFNNLTDDQLNNLIESKIHQVGIDGSVTGEGKQN